MKIMYWKKHIRILRSMKLENFNGRILSDVLWTDDEMMKINKIFYCE